MDFVEHKLLRGQGAGKYLPFARTKVAALHARAKALGVTVLVQRWKVDGGMADIAVRVVEDQRYIHIRRKSCPPFLSGLCDLQQPDFIVQVPDPAGGPDPVFALHEFYPSPASEIRDVRDDVTLGRHPTIPLQMLGVRASMFTGEMRKVVQIIQGRGDTLVPYNPSWLVTHGIYKASSGARWVIEISPDGVAAWPLQMCRNPVRHPVTDEVLLEYTPIPTPPPTDFIEALAAGTYRILLDAAGVYDAYSKIRFFDDCGWAFNADGSKASNVCYEHSGAIKSYLYTIEITEVDGKPSIAAMSERASGFVLGPHTVQMKYPRQTQLQSLDLLIPGVPSTLPGPVNGPVYCFYDGMQLVVIRYIRELWQQDNSYAEGANLCTLAGTADVCMSDIGRELKNGTENVFAQPHFVAEDLSLNMQTSFYQRSYDSGQWTMGEFVGSGAANTFSHGTLYYRASATRDVGYFDSTSVGSVMVVPWGDREAVYFGEVQGRITNASTRFDDTDGQAAFESDVGLGFGGRDFRELCEFPHTRFCTDLPAVAIAGTIGGRAYPYWFCANGSPLVRFTPVTNFTYYSAGPGSELQYKKDFPDCGGSNPPDGKTLNTVIGPATPIQQSNTRETHFIFYASGGIVREITPVDNVIWFVFADALWYNQGAEVMRDAFDPSKYVATKELGAAAYGEGRSAGLFWNAADYPIAETVGQLAFVGVP